MADKPAQSTAEETADILAMAAAEAAAPGADTENAYECPFCVMMSKGGCEEPFQVKMLFALHKWHCIVLQLHRHGRHWQLHAQQLFAAAQAASISHHGYAIHTRLNSHSASVLFEQSIRGDVCMQGFMACGEKADKGEVEMADCLKEVRASTQHQRWHSCCAHLALHTQCTTVVTLPTAQQPAACAAVTATAAQLWLWQQSA